MHYIQKYFTTKYLHNHLCNESRHNSKGENLINLKGIKAQQSLVEQYASSTKIQDILYIIPVGNPLFAIF